MQAFPGDFGLICLNSAIYFQNFQGATPHGRKLAIYVNQPGSIVRILEKVREAKTPDRFTVDFLETKLGFRGGNYRQLIPLAKKIGLLNSDGTPTELYKKFRNGGTSKAAVAQATLVIPSAPDEFDNSSGLLGMTRE